MGPYISFCHPMPWQKGCDAGGLHTLRCLSWEAAAFLSVCEGQAEGTGWIVNAVALPGISVMALAAANRGARYQGQVQHSVPPQPQVWRPLVLLCSLLPLWAEQQPLLNFLHNNRMLLPQDVHETRDVKRHMPVSSAPRCWQCYTWTYCTAPTPFFAGLAKS